MMRIIKILSLVALPFVVARDNNQHERLMKRLAETLGESTKASLDRQKILEELARFRPMTYAYWINGEKITKHLWKVK